MDSVARTFPQCDLSPTRDAGERVAACHGTGMGV